MVRVKFLSDTGRFRAGQLVELCESDASIYVARAIAVPATSDDIKAAARQADFEKIVAEKVAAAFDKPAKSRSEQPVARRGSGIEIAHRPAQFII